MAIIMDVREYVAESELRERLARFTAVMDASCKGWDTAIILSKVNQYYFTGTMQDGMLVIKKVSGASYFVRKSYERARDESPLSEIFPMNSYRDVAAALGAGCGNTYMETEIVTIGILSRLRRHLELGEIHSLDQVVSSVRAVKSPYELELMRLAGKSHVELLENIVPTLLREGISEADFIAELYAAMVKYGHQGICRFSMFQTEMVLGEVGFGDSSLYPTSFDGPGGARGIHPAVPILGSRERKLRRGDLVFVDVGFGIGGYQSDKTQVYMYRGTPDSETVKAHRGCIEVQTRTAALLKPGAIPAEIYTTVTDALDNDFKRDFMGFGSRRVTFLGHGIGLHVDEPPVIAGGFHEPLRENMTIALEPKKGIEGVGMVGVEDTYIVTPSGGECITGGGKDIILL
jgi:Xaa-Pro aminopeptidase